MAKNRHKKPTADGHESPTNVIPWDTLLERRREAELRQGRNRSPIRRMPFRPKTTGGKFQV